MFTKRDRKWFVTAGFLLLGGYLCMAFDPVENGFGMLTLWIAPPLLLLGFLVVIPGISGGHVRLFSNDHVKGHQIRYIIAGTLFLTSLITYVLTIEPTASLWDCSEFIASSYKLQIPHTPGNPLLLLLGRLFAMLALDDTSNVALAVNMMSAVFAAGTIVVVYFIILRMGSMMKFTTNEIALVMSAAAGSFCLAFSDTFWFSAVEAETYAASCFFLFLIVFLIQKGLDLEGESRVRMAILIFYISGLAFCIHPMCVLALPLLPITWYLQKRRVTIKSITIAFIAGITIVVFINRFIAIGVFEFTFFLDRILVNTFGLPFYSGAFLFLAILVLACRTILTRWIRLVPYTWCAVMLLIGFAPYIMLFIRSNHNPPIDESNPENLQLIKAYMNREGYPTRPLLLGPYFDAEVTEVRGTTTVYAKSDDKYIESGKIAEYGYEKDRQTILPRIYSTDPAHIDTYRQWTGLQPDEKPGFVDNVSFMLRYQLGHMYLRYIMFNFSGRESDQQNSDWLRPWEPASEKSQLDNRARNQYWMIPLVLGLIGASLQFIHDKKGFVSNAAAFLVTGALLVLYLNSTPNEPRERDYIYVGSYVAFSIWIGIGIYALLSLIPKRASFFSIPIIFIVPAWMMYENWDDHNRSGRTFQIDNAKNILNNCAPNALLFTGGDNDTFPLWYLQEVEGFRTDVRVVVLSYLNTDWYINQLRKDYYESKAFRFTLDRNQYRQYGPNDVLYVHEKIRNAASAPKFLDLLQAEHQAIRVETNDGDYYNSIPSKKFYFPLSDSANSAEIQITERYLQKNALAIVDILVNNPERPLYFNFTSMQQTGLDLQPYLIQEGHVYRLDLASGKNSAMEVDTHLSFANLIEKGNYENLMDDKVYFNYEDYELRIVNPLRQTFNFLAMHLVQQGEEQKAEKVLTTAMKYFYQPRFKPNFSNLQAANLLLNLGKKSDAARLAKDLYSFNENEIRNGNAGELELQLREYASDILSSIEDR
jgi:hypothetical protein